MFNPVAQYLCSHSALARRVRYEDAIRRETEQPFMTQFLDKKTSQPYQYAILPLERRFSPVFSRAVTRGLTHMLYEELHDANVLIVPEAKAFLMVGLAQEAGLTVVPLRKRDYNVPYQIEIGVRGYKGETERLFCVGLRPGDRPLFVDDMVSTGGTQIGVERAFRLNGYMPVGMGSLFGRGDGVKNVFEETGRRVKVLAEMDVAAGVPRITRFYKR